MKNQTLHYLSRYAYHLQQAFSRALADNDLETLRFLNDRLSSNYALMIGLQLKNI